MISRAEIATRTETPMRFLMSLALCALASCGQGDAVSAPPSASVATPIEIVDLDGREGVLSAHRGRAVVLNLWAMW